MRSPSLLKAEIEERLRRYLSRDKNGLRHEVLRLFVRMRSLTVREIYDYVKERFNVTYHSLASMVGTIASRIGILRVRKSVNNTTSVYELKEEYRDLLVRALKAG
ncbi:MAG: DUF2551 domain-containing protein [Methanoculleaceae archaeon]